MSDNLITEILNVTGIAASGAGAVVDTGVFASIDKNVRPQPKGALVSPDARFSISTTAFTGTDMLVEIVAVIGGVDVVLKAFTSVTGLVVESIEITNCPTDVKVVYTANAVTDFAAKVFAIRF